MTNLDDLERFLQGVPQLVPEEACFRCRICCRFPDTQNVQTPFWSEGETYLAQKAGGSEGWFIPLPDTVSRGVRLEKCGEGYRCPAFDPGTSRCAIHALKPLDCRLYPFVLTMGPGGNEVVLAMDRKCPYLQEQDGDPAVSAYARRLEEYLSTPQAQDYLRSNPKIIGPWWPEYVAVADLPEAVSLIREKFSSAPHPALKPVGPEDWARLEPFFRFRPHAFSGYSRAALCGWQDLIRFFWADLEGVPVVFAEQGGGWFMPLPPLFKRFQPDVAEKAWALLVEMNQGSGVSRVEGIEPAMAGAWERIGFRIRLSAREYLYRREALARLRGNRYRSQRGAINRFLRAGHLPCRIRPFEPGDRTACLQLYTRWAIEKQKRCEPGYARSLVRNGLFFHRRILMHGEEWGLQDLVAEIGGRVAGYTFGSALSRKIFCVFVEITDPSLPGLGAFLFREFCRRLEGFDFINAMGDEGLEGMRRAKQSYRPIGFAMSYAADRVYESA